MRGAREHNNRMWVSHQTRALAGSESASSGFNREARKAGRRSPNRGEMTGTRGRQCGDGRRRIRKKCLTKGSLRPNESHRRG